MQTNLLITVFLMFSLHYVSAQHAVDYSIDHISIVVNNLEEAQKTYKDLGFTIKPGRKHSNSIENAHIKFQDGSALELITASEPKDDLAELYIKNKVLGEGPVFLAIHMEDANITKELLSELNPRLAEESFYQWLTFTEEENLSYLFFIKYSNPVIDKKEHLNHKNEVIGIKAIALSKPDYTNEEKLFSYLGQKVPIAKKIVVGDHDILLDTKDNNRSQPFIASVTLLVKDIDETLEALPKAIPFQITKGLQVILPKEYCHGIEIILEQKD